MQIVGHADSPEDITTRSLMSTSYYDLDFLLDPQPDSLQTMKTPAR